ncbi:unnamed protein product [Adineta steineri]|uniref:NmrA-like domain-containing protein n=1 Tax=Adineta steineri TaxID=433720 RepID=A0A818WST1_9BILA|nr:unnamed protein product [Adineta steineri]CAF3730654.1 unnamed protein product [Adineta steineri]
MSHKGPDTMYYTDMKGKKHPDPYVGVTTIYCLNEDGTRIFFADPWLQNKFENELTTPEDGQFIAESMATSGSTLFLIQRGRNEFGKEINKMYTRFADFDSIGSNPALASTYNPNNNVPLVRYLPSEDCIKQPFINIQGKARSTKNISIYQIGWGQNNRQLRVQGTDVNEKLSHRGLNERGLHTKLILILDKNNQISIPLYARRGWRSLIGLSKSNLWKLVIPLEYLQNDNYQIQLILEKIFQNKFRHNVYVYETKQEIFITNTFYFQKQGAKLIFGELDDPVGLEKSLEGIDVVICLLTGHDQEILFNGQKSLIEASKKAHVKRFITSVMEWIYLELSSEKECYYYVPKQRIESLLENDSSVEHTFIATGLFAELLFIPRFGIDIKQRIIKSFGSSDMKISTTFSDDIALLLPDIILLDESKNARINLASFTTTFKEIQQIAENISGEKFQFIEDRSYENLTKEQLYNQVTEFVKSVYARGDGYFDKPFNKVHPILSKISTTTLEDYIKIKLSE